MAEYIYYAKPIGAPDHHESIVLEVDRKITKDEQERLDKALVENNMELVRVMEWNWEKPDFAGTVNL